jgi:hypothetical protein
MANPPAWAPNAVATKQGWTDPVTGELLIAIEGLLQDAPKTQETSTVTEETPTEESPAAE